MNAEDTSVVTLTGALDIAHVAGLKTSLQDALDSAQGDTISLDVTAVSRSDAAGIQLLLAFARHCKTQKQSWQWAGQSEVLLADATGLGLAGELQLHTQSQGGQ